MRRLLYEGYIDDPENEKYIVVMVARGKHIFKFFGYYKWNDEDEVQKVPFYEDYENAEYHFSGRNIEE